MLVGWWLATTALATDYTVDPSGGGDYTTIQDAIDDPKKQPAVPESKSSEVEERLGAGVAKALEEPTILTVEVEQFCS